MTAYDISNIFLIGTLEGTIGTSANTGTPFLKEGKITVAQGSKIYSIPVSGFGQGIDGAESLIGQQVVAQAHYGLDRGQGANADKVFGNVQIDTLHPGTDESVAEFRQSGVIVNLETKEKLTSVTLLVNARFWNKTEKKNELLEREIRVAFFGDDAKLLDNIVRGQPVLIEGEVRSSENAGKVYTDFVGKKIRALGTTDAVSEEEL